MRNKKTEAFFESYRTAFARQDAEGVAGHFVYPCHVTSDTGEDVRIVAATEQEWSAQIRELFELYTLARQGERIRISAIAHDEVSRAREHLARGRSPRASGGTAPAE